MLLLFLALSPSNHPPMPTHSALPYPALPATLVIQQVVCTPPCVEMPMKCARGLTDWGSLTACCPA